MTSTQLATLLDTSEDTIRRWTKDYAPHLSPSANPPKGEARVYTERDVRILAYVAALRNTGNSLKTIEERLETTDLDTLPAVPGWEQPEPAMIPAEQVGIALEVVQLRAALRTAEQDRDRALAGLEEAKTEVVRLKEQLGQAERDQATSIEEITQLRIQLAQAEGKVAAIEGQLHAYSLGGRQLSPLVLIGLVLAMAVLLVVALLVVGRLL